MASDRAPNQRMDQKQVSQPGSAEIPETRPYSDQIGGINPGSDEVTSPHFPAVDFNRAVSALIVSVASENLICFRN